MQRDKPNHFAMQSKTDPCARYASILTEHLDSMAAYYDRPARVQSFHH